eukprot:Phypoly_transcript_00834.p1 GENE.Phypoly_transcript_00834~~Phypoly_transcript_00834.p1  ORF type:complete len:1260 (+),score=134.49 Phypoly_transcript_00834:229-3780(+)
MGEGGIWDDSNSTSYCTTEGCTTCDGEETTNKFSPDEWSVSVAMCRGGGYLQWIRMDTNLGNYWTAGNYTKCEAPPTIYPTSGPINGVKASKNQVDNGIFAISSISFQYFNCLGPDCPAYGYNGGGLCGTKNGGCDVHTQCDNANGCSGCPIGFTGTGDSICVPDGEVAPVAVYKYDNSTVLGQASDQICSDFSATPNTYKLSRIRAYYSLLFGVFTEIDVCFRALQNGVYHADEDCSSVSIDPDMNLVLQPNQWVTSIGSCSNSLGLLMWIKFVLNDGSVYATGNNISCTSFASLDITADSALVGFTAFSQSTLLLLLYISGLSPVIATCVSDCPVNFYGPPVSDCLRNNGGCGEFAVCSDNGTLSCTCFPGYVLADSGCQEIDLCAAQPCVEGTECIQTKPNFFTCGACPSGFVGSGYTQCQDIDECINENNCSLNATCTNFVGNYSCTCNEGFVGDGFHCQDNDRCTTDADCGQYATCTNVSGSGVCVCLHGFSGDGLNCTDDNECETRARNCSAAAHCINTPGTFECVCFDGYTGDGFYCTDINECENATSVCAPHASCTNIAGSYYCTCNRGFTGNGTFCSDLDECLGRTNCSKVGGVCVNVEGSYACECGPGYFGNGYYCSDVNECANDTHACGANSTCTNYIGSYGCACISGFVGDGHNCTDIDECASATTNNCSTFGSCTNTPGSFSCACKDGFSGDGYHCTDINECKQIVNPCSPPFICNNTIGSFSCDCPVGYFKFNDSCHDKDECKHNNGGCDFSVTCTNTPGGRECGECPFGSVGNGYAHCTSLCGDGICDFRFENCVTCPRDCPSPTCNICGDMSCDVTNGETCATCFEDCGPCSPECNPSCGEHGTCVNGFCQCSGNWTGPSCSTAQSNPIQINVARSHPAVAMISSDSFGTKQQFTLSINKIVELDSENATVTEISARRLNFTLSESVNGSNRVFNFSAVLENRAILYVLVYQFENCSTTVNFANTRTAYPPNTVKLSVRVRGWPFMGVTNSLGIVLNSPYTENATSHVSCVNHQEDESGNLRWFMVSINGTALYGQFLDRAVADGRIRKVTYQLGRNTTAITAIIPHFWEYADMDPDFSVLLGDKNGKCVNGKKTHDMKALKIVVPLVLGLALVACIIIVTYPRMRYLWRTRHAAGPQQEPVQSTELSDISNLQVASPASNSEIMPG